VLEIIDGLGLPCALLTNNGPILEACLDVDLPGLADRFSPILLSWRLGTMKPAPAAFERASEVLGHAAEHLLLVDDELANVRGAQACGWQAVWSTTAPALAHSLRLARAQP
jgi:HAD superfamily hydrolase (TIGR01509 family)